MSDYQDECARYDHACEVTRPCIEPLRALAAATSVQAVLYMMDGLTDEVEGFCEKVVFDAWPELKKANADNLAKMDEQKAKLKTQINIAQFANGLLSAQGQAIAATSRVVAL